MLRLLNQIGIGFAKPGTLTRCFVTGANKSLDDLDREKKIKIFELEISVSFMKNILFSSVIC